MATRQSPRPSDPVSPSASCWRSSRIAACRSAAFASTSPQLGAELPMLQAAPQPDLANYKGDRLHALHDLGWVDAASGVAHVPIEQAMAMRATQAANSGAPR
jgi:hypothetical protein